MTRCRYSVILNSKHRNEHHNDQQHQSLKQKTSLDFNCYL